MHLMDYCASGNNMYLVAALIPVLFAASVICNALPFKLQEHHP